MEFFPRIQKEHGNFMSVFFLYPWEDFAKVQSKKSGSSFA